MAWMIGPLAKLLDGLPALLAPFLTWVGNFPASFMSHRGVVEARTSSPDCSPKSTFPLGISHKSPTPPRTGGEFDPPWCSEPSVGSNPPQLP